MLGRVVVSGLSIDSRSLAAFGQFGGLERSSEERRDNLYSWITRNPPPGIEAEEIQAHFEGMPLRYWDRVSEVELVWGLQTIHKFLKLVAQPNSPGTSPVLDFRQFPEGRCTHVMLCTWDRGGLLAKAAAAFSAVRINVLQADVFTRADNIILDVFRVCEMQQTPVINDKRLAEMLFLLEGALSDPPRFASFWASSRHKLLGHTSTVSPVVMFDNTTSPAHTLLGVDASDRLGLLSDILETLANCDLNIHQAIIDTDNSMARDLFFLSDLKGNKISDEERLGLIRKRLLEAITNTDTGSC